MLTLDNIKVELRLYMKWEEPFNINIERERRVNPRKFLRRSYMNIGRIKRKES